MVYWKCANKLSIDVYWFNKSKDPLLFSVMSHLLDNYFCIVNQSLSALWSHNLIFLIDF